jgi:hypothetical protein
VFLFIDIILNIKYLFIYIRSKLKLVKGQLASYKILLDTSSAPFSPIEFLLKIRKEKVKNPINYYNNKLIS